MDRQFKKDCNIVEECIFGGLEHQKGEMDYLTLEEALKIISSKPDENDRLRQQMAVIRVQDFLDSLYVFED